MRIQEVKYPPKTAKKNFILKPKSELLKKENIKVSSFLKSEEKTNYFLLKNSVNLKEMTWIRIRIHFFPVRIEDPDPH